MAVDRLESLRNESMWTEHTVKSNVRGMLHILWKKPIKHDTLLCFENTLGNEDVLYIGQSFSITSWVIVKLNNKNHLL